MRQIEIVTTVILSLAVLATGPVGALAQAGPGDGRETLARALQGASLPLERGLTASAAVGIPLSGKYEIDDGAFQLSVYTWKGDAVAGDSFTEVIVDYSTGNVSKVETITDDGDLAAAQSQKTAMTRAKRWIPGRDRDAEPGVRRARRRGDIGQGRRLEGRDRTPGLSRQGGRRR